MTRKFGLLGKNIDYSFSRGYFSEKFTSEAIDATYQNFDIESISQFSELLQNQPNLSGMNVTIPFKESVMKYLDELDDVAKDIGAVNTIKFNNKKRIGYNTDYYGFCKSIQPHLKSYHDKALILGTGGASKAIAYGLKTFNIPYIFVSRNPDFNEITYAQLDEETINSYPIIINCTPLGTSPHIDRKPNIPYEALSEKHLLFDLIYNPSETTFLRLGKAQGATIVNGSKMLEYQAEKSWEIWNS